MQLFENLYWRPNTSLEMKTVLRDIIADNDVSGFKYLLCHNLGERELTLIDGMDELNDIKHQITDINIRLGIVSNSTTEFFAPSLRSSALRYGINLDIVQHDYSQALESVQVDGTISQQYPDLLLIALDQKVFDQSNELAMMVLECVKQNFNIPIIVQTVPHRVADLYGNTDYKYATSQKLINDYNAYLKNTKTAFFIDLVVDISHLANTVGLNNWYDERIYNLAKMPFAPQNIPLYTEKITRSIACLKGITGKCMVLDLDNTLWGGVVGDDGINGIKIGQGDPVSEAFSEFQSIVKSLKNRGVILTVCSKNDMENAVEPFKAHNDMILRYEDITLFVANWNDKARNIRSISEELNIGLNSMVFVDDNPAERELIRRTLPDVNVIEMPDDPAYFGRTLLSSGAFESISVSDEDRKKAEQYTIRRQALELESSSTDYESYLESLNMVCHVQPFNEINRMRITQLINKTNQFNLTTRRYTELQVKEFEENDNILTIHARLKDRFGDHGIVAVLIGTIAENTLHIDSFLMSCRVLKRGLEYSLINYLFEFAKSRKLDLVEGEYIATKKNAIVKNLYSEMGFRRKNNRWFRKVENFTSIKTHIKLIDDCEPYDKHNKKHDPECNQAGG